MKKALIFTLGCRLNQADTALMTDRLRREGYEILPPLSSGSGNPDLIVVNSCTVTANAAAKSRRAVAGFRRRYPEALLVLTGCSAEVDYEEKRFLDERTIVLRNPEKRDLGTLLSEFLANHNLSGRPQGSAQECTEPFHEQAFGAFPFKSRAFLKIQEGCNNFCTYCIVPHTRGRERSRAFDEVVADFRHAVAAGYPEIVLTGVNTCAYFDAGKTLVHLLETLCTEIPGAWRIRLSSTEPHPGNREILQVMARYPERICRFLHLSLQHGSDRILRQMNRHYDTHEYAEFLAEARELMPEIHLGTDVIVGFPGETEADFEESCRFIEAMQFANTHIFTYSRREGTPAADFPDQVVPQVAHRRMLHLQEITQRSAAEFRRRMIGKTLPVIFETVDEHAMAHGWTDNYLAVSKPQDQVELHRILSIPFCD